MNRSSLNNIVAYILFRSYYPDITQRSEFRDFAGARLQKLCTILRYLVFLNQAFQILESLRFQPEEKVWNHDDFKRSKNEGKNGIEIYTTL